MTEDLREAAERLANRDLACFQGPTGDDADMRAGIKLAKAFLANNPADSDEVDWRDPEVEKVRSEWPLQLDEYNRLFCGEYELGRVRTIGQLRRLVAALEGLE